MSLNLRELRIRLAKLALDIESENMDDGNMAHLPPHMLIELNLIHMSVHSELKRIKAQREKEYIESPR